MHTIQRPLIGITADAGPDRIFLRQPYVDAIVSAGGAPVVLAPSAVDDPDGVPAAAVAAARCDGLILSGGDDPRMEAFGEPTHPRATPVTESRQRLELAVLDVAAGRPEMPVLGICLGMQYMGLVAGGRLDQYLPDALPTADDHWNHLPHQVSGRLGDGTVSSHHRQALTDAGSLEIVARATDGVIEAIEDPARRFWLGVQWHPERTGDTPLGMDLIRRFVATAVAVAAGGH
ncbi:MAG: gamma-glutamyl-gamma-aminobutyrate hydrolase family protein [Phycisphaerales bacterium]